MHPTLRLTQLTPYLDVRKSAQNVARCLREEAAVSQDDEFVTQIAAAGVISEYDGGDAVLAIEKLNF